MASIKKNFAWSTLLTASGYLFPLITFPYVTRVLGVEGIGNNQFAESVVSYFSSFAMLGIGTVGVREIAKHKNDKVELSRSFCSLLILSLLLTIIVISILVFLINLIPSFIQHKSILYIGSAKILCGTLVVEWFFKGVEDFHYITVRSILLRFFYVLSVFIFVKEPNDYILYFTLSTITLFINVLVNLIYLRRYVSISFCNLNILQYIKPIFVLGLYLLLTQMYVSFNVIYLGSVCGDIEVGYYSTATKLYGIIISVFSAFTGVMLPFMTKLVAEGKNSEFQIRANKSIDFLLLFCVPTIIIAEIFAPQIIQIIAGTGYDGAILPMRIIVPLMLVIGYEQILVLQMLVPLEKDKEILINSFIGAVFSLLLNIFIVPILASVGSSIVWILSEIVVAIFAQFYVTKYTGYHFPIKMMAKTLLCFFPALVICGLINIIIEERLVSFLIGISFVSIYFVIVEIFILKNDLLLSNIKILEMKFYQKMNIRVKS